MNATTPNATATTTPPEGTFVHAPFTLQDGILLYRPEDNSFMAIYGDEWPAIRLDALENNQPISELQEANASATEKAIALRELQQRKDVTGQALKDAEKALAEALNKVAEKSQAAKKKIEPIKTLANDPNKLYELVPLTMRRVVRRKDGRSEKTRLFTPIYVRADKLKSVMADKRVYLVEGAAERKKHPKDKLLVGATLNTDEIKRRIADKAQDNVKFKKEWKLAPADASAYSGILFDWAKTMGADAKTFLERTQQQLAEQILPASLSHDPKDPYRSIDLKADAQLMRWSGGAGLETNFMPFQGSLFDKRDKDWKSRAKRAARSARFGIKANAEASFAVGEAKVETVAYFPHYTGWEMSPSVLGQPFNFGYFRMQADLLLYGLAGASVALEADIGLMLTGDKQGVRGTPKAAKGGKAKVGAKAGIDLFAGLKEGVQLSGAMQWLNPEGMLGNSKPKKVAPDKAVAEYADIAKVSGTAEAIQGLSAQLGFECAFRNGAFRVVGDMNLCLGLGGGGKVAAEVGAATIGNFFMCTCHLLKQADYKKMQAVMNQNTFDLFNKIMFLVAGGTQDLRSFIGKEEDEIVRAYDGLISDIRRNGRDFLIRLRQQMTEGWGWFAYMPPESRGAMMLAINDALENTPGDSETRLAAAFCTNELLCTVQTGRHLDKTLERLSYSVGEQRDTNAAKRTITALVADSQFAGALEGARAHLGNAQPLIGRPFLRNDDLNFVTATFPLHGVGYTTV